MLKALLHEPSTSHTHRAHLAMKTSPYAFDLSVPRRAHNLQARTSGLPPIPCPNLRHTIYGPTDRLPTYYTVNPQAVNEWNSDIFIAKWHLVVYIQEAREGELVALAAIGMTLVGSVGWSLKKGDSVGREEGLGWFACGGSAVLPTFPQGLTKFDQDLQTNSMNELETLIKVSDPLGTLKAQNRRGPTSTKISLCIS